MKQNRIYFEEKERWTVPSRSGRILYYTEPHGLAVPYDIPDYKESKTSAFTEERSIMSVTGIVNPSAVDPRAASREALDSTS